MRVIWPSAKMQTISPARIASLALRSDVQHFARTQFGGNRNRADHFRERLDERMVVDALVHQEADGPVGGRDSSSASTNDMWLADEQRAAGFGDVFAAFDADAIDRVRRNPEHQAHQRIGQQDRRVRGGAQREHRADQENARGIRVPR